MWFRTFPHCSWSFGRPFDRSPEWQAALEVAVSSNTAKGAG